MPPSQNYHYGSAASADGVHWHSYSDMSMQIDARADTLNNVVYDPDLQVQSFPVPVTKSLADDDHTQEYMTFTRLDCGVPPFGDNPSLKGCATDGFGMRRSARSTSRAFGAGANWSRAETCLHGSAGDECYTLVPFRDTHWRPGLYLGFASFLNTTVGGTFHVRNELVSSGDFGASWTRLAPQQAFIPFGSAAKAFDSHGVYASHPVTDPDNADCLRLYYRGSNGPHVRLLVLPALCVVV